MHCFPERRLVRDLVNQAIASKAQLLKDHCDEFAAGRARFGLGDSPCLAQPLAQQELNAGLAGRGQGFKVWVMQVGHRVIPVGWDQSRYQAYVQPNRQATRKDCHFRVN